MDTEVALLKSLAEPTRLRLVVLLALNGETCVCNLAAALAVPQFHASRHLGVLRGRGVVEARREGTWMHYRLSVPRSRLEECLHECFRDCLVKHPMVVTDLARLKEAESKGHEVARECPASRKSGQRGGRTARVPALGGS